MFNTSDVYLPPLPAFPFRVPAPVVDPDEGTQRAFCIAQEWIPVMLAALQVLTLPTTWQGDDSDILLAQQRAGLLCALIANPDLCSVMGSTQYRYDDATDTVQTSDDGGATWADNPGADPRNNTLLPPLTTSDPQCDSAATMTAALKAMIDQQIAFLNTGATALQIIGGVLSLLSLLGLFGIFASIVADLAAAVVTLGASGMSSAFPSTVWDTLLCIIECLLATDGTLSDSSLALLKSQVDSDIGGSAATIVQFMLLIMGTAGLNDARLITGGAVTGDCSGCSACDWVVEYDLADGNQGWFISVVSGVSFGAFDGAQFIGTKAPTQVECYVIKHLPGIAITGIALFALLFTGTGLAHTRRVTNLSSLAGGTTIANATYSSVSPAAWFTSWTGSFTIDQYLGVRYTCDTNGTGSTAIQKIRIAGTGTPPSDGIRVASL